MAKLLKTLLFGVLIGVGIGLILSEQQRRREEKAEAEDYAKDPELVAIRKEWAKERRVEEWLSELEDDDA